MIHIGWVLIAKWLAAHHIIGTAAAHHGSVAAAGHTAAAHHALTAAAGGHAAAAHHALTATIIGTTIETSTIGGIVFVNTLNNLLNDTYKQVKSGLRLPPSGSELSEIIDTASLHAKLNLLAKRLLTPDASREMGWLALRAKLELAS
jgi:hypothetical protein